MPGWIQHVREDGTTEWIEKTSKTRTAAPIVIPDIEDYQSPVTGKPISGRRQRREDLRRHGCVEYDAGMRDDAARIREQKENALVDSMVERMRWHNA